MSTFILILLVVFVLGPLAGGVAKRLEGGRSAPPPEGLGGADAERLARLEGQVEALADRVHELAEHQEFLTRLLEAPTPGGRPALEKDGDR
ncbi:MAG: hypothetical protein RRA92_09380 [Gemmatimonadota bacterium]|nr:hypothetical protein [Gemmatimonadota bacterium]